MKMRQKRIIVSTVAACLLVSAAVAFILLSRLLSERRQAEIPGTQSTVSYGSTSPESASYSATARTSHSTEPTAHNAPRRPIVADGTVLTPNGTLMRGMISGVNEMLMTGDMEI